MKDLNKQIAATTTIMAVIIFLVMPQFLRAQAIYKLLPGKDVAIKVLGSSNVHDWTETATGLESQGDFKFEGDQLRSLRSFSFAVDVKSLKSDHESMDNRTYKTIKADKFPTVTYKLSSAVVTLVQKNKYAIKATGDLTIAGNTQTIVLNVSAVVNADNTISCTGSQKIQLTDYKIDPPSFMLGAMKVKNDLTIQFNLVYKNNQLLTKTN
ncbi:YceI family protein [Mucilaginibacter sp. OK098]|uniref:YceI family protein n=1 Tax=Mucilaginibacter sp. OK098 TaxID=1855297 RepID=UPI0009229775|nr:YceI family protein [Mucilaginibacter sp. OK098]SHN14071.1 YceI-like domain-containing protein [Mucilaginibacter sp. OK098]